MKRYHITVYTTAEFDVEVEAENEDEAVEEAYSHWPQLCHHCARDVTLGDDISAQPTVEEIPS